MPERSRAKGRPRGLGEPRRVQISARVANVEIRDTCATQKTRIDRDAHGIFGIRRGASSSSCGSNVRAQPLTFNVVHFAIVGGKRALVAANNKISQQVNMLQTLSMYVHTQYDHIPVHVTSKDRVDASGDKQRLESLS